MGSDANPSGGSLDDRVQALRLCDRSKLAMAVVEATRPALDIDSLVNLACMTLGELVDMCLTNAIHVDGAPDGR